MNHPDNQATFSKKHSSQRYDDNTRLDKLGERSSAHTGQGSVGVARTINDIMADLEKGDEKKVALKNLGHGMGANLDKQALEGSNEMTRGDSGLTVYKVDTQNGFDVFNYGSGDDAEDITDIAEDLDLLRVYDPNGASESIQTRGPEAEPSEVDFIEDSRTYGVPNVVVEVGRNVRSSSNEIPLRDPSSHADDTGRLLSINGYDDVAVRHDVTTANDIVYASDQEMVTK